MTKDRNAAGSIARDDLVTYLDGYLEASRAHDYCPNGLQVEGRSRLHKVVTGVSACRQLFQEARGVEADAVIVHHGLFWTGSPQVLTGVLYRRVAELIEAGINLLAYHLPLDRHPQVGNNAVAARKLGLVGVEPFGMHEDLPLGVRGTLEAPAGLHEFVEKIARLFGSRPLTFPSGPGQVSSVGIVSGAAGRCLHEAIAQRLDLFLTGEAEEWTMNLAKEAEIHVVAAGHHATERLGIQALGDHLEGRFGLDVEFIDVPNPV